ncbi:unnamed protein product [Tilletia controversa]|uniref:Cep57 centrosome microtubule-binding domain-containing protein n=3 Tax=Tilletia TaxID=13289 RepID=A0A8X7SVH0_9BASI|nr:hypothetical protein CF336_g5120 [Tilletia laevis]KAE8194476.1 hypothetical protein CF328_g4734 [Tilletia controversa]KAE8260266.1 hypothetical protein A4X03_0g3862 [Tilletia caries]KAE8198471.1 hypothetical protein CF335_g4378 [Tilletia laevis]KAE8245590.1 hypothetical protein A4X06_0g5567 [Tilletia controversa]
MPRIGASNNINTYTRTLTRTTDSAAFSDQHPSTAYRRHSDSDDDADEGTSTDSTGNHRHLEATPARALSAHEHRRLDRAQQNRPFSTATLDGINISHAVHWLANKQIRSAAGPPTTTATTTTAVRSERSPLPLPLPIQRQEIPPAAPTHQQHKHSTLRKNPTSSLLSAANKVPASAPPAALSAAPFPHPSTIHSHRPSAPSPPPAAHTEQQQQQVQSALAPAPEPEPASARTAPLPIPEPMPQYTSTSAANMSFARLPDMTGLTSAMGTPGRPLHAFHHIPVDPAYPAPRTRSSRPPPENIAPVHVQAQAQAQAQAPVQVQANHQQHPVLNLRARVETDEDSDDDSGSGESESVMHFPLTNTKQQSPATPKKRHAATTVSLRPAAAAAPSALVASESVASDSHPHLFLQGLDHPRNEIARAAEEAARRFGVEWEGANPPLSAYAVEQLELQQLAATQKSKQKARSTNGSSPSPPVISPGESTAKLNHMHDELAKIVDRLGRLEAESAPPPQAREGAAGGGYRRRGARAGPLETDSSGTEGGNNPPALSRGAIKDMQAHMRELMREMQRQRRAMASLVELEKDEVRDEIEAGEKVRRSLGLPPPPAAAAAAGELELERRGRRTSARDAASGAEGGAGSAGEEGRRRLPSPSKTIRQKRLRMERAESEAVGAGAGAAEAVAEARPAAAVVPPSSWSGDPHALRSHMGDVMRHVHLLRDEVERGLHPGSSYPVDRQTASSPLQADRNDIFDHRPASPFLRPTRETRSSPPPATQHRPSEEEDEGGMDVSRIAQERAAEAFAKVRQYSELRRAPAPSPPSKRGPSLFPEQQRSVSTQTQNQARNGAMLADEPVHWRNARAPATSSSHDLEHNERDCGVCQAPVKAAQRREARRDRVRREDRERRRGSGQESNTETEEEEVLIDLLVEEAERHRKLIARNGRNNNNNRAGQEEEEAAADPVSSWRELIVLSPAQRESLIRMAKQHMDEFIHQRMLYAELADELKGVHPGMNAMRRRILGEHVMEAVELLEMKAERINVLQKLLGQGSARDDEYEERQREEEEAEVEERRRRAVRASKYEARPQRVVRPKVSSRLRHEVEAELASDYSDAEDPEEERIHLSAAAAAAAAAAATRATSGHRLRQQRSTSPVLPEDRQAARGQTRAQHSSMSSKGSPPRQNSGSRPVSRASRPRGLQTEYSPPTTLAAREIAGDLQDDDEHEDGDGDETEVGTDDGFGLDLDLGGGGGGGRSKAEGRAGSRQQQQRYAFGMGAGEQQGRPRSARTAGSGSSVGQAFGGGRRSRP